MLTVNTKEVEKGSCSKGLKLGFQQTKNKINMGHVPGRQLVRVILFVSSH